jgi:ankyrin repeat protein
MTKRKSRLLALGAVAIIVLLPVAGGIWWFSPQQQQARRNRVLMAACMAGDVKGAQQALEENAAVNARDDNGITPLMYAARGDRPILDMPAATDHPDVVQLLLDKGADVNAATDSGFVALFWAARYGHEKVVKLLIDYGANVNAKDKDRLTALKWANVNRTALPATYDRVIAMLKAAGATE